MPRIDERVRELLGTVTYEVSVDDVPVQIERRRARFERWRRVASAALTVVVLGATAGGYVAAQRAFGADRPPPVPAATSAFPTTSPTLSPSPPPTPSDEIDLGLGFPVCRVTSMPLPLPDGNGTAAVFTKMPGANCPQPDNAGYVGVGIDVDGDGRLDATYGPADCPFGCYAFAAPDVNADGVAEVAISAGMADGIRIQLFAVSTGDHPSIEPIALADAGNGFLDPGPVEFALGGTVGWMASAQCGYTEYGKRYLRIDQGTLVTGKRAFDVRSTLLLIDGADATVWAWDRQTLSFNDLPSSGGGLCGAPIAGAAPTPTPTPTPDPMEGCHFATVQGDFDGDGVQESAKILCDRDQPSVDIAWSSGAVGSWALSDCSALLCVPWAVADIDGDGNDELLMLSAGERDPYRYGFVLLYDLYPSEASGDPIRLASSGGDVPLFPAGEVARFPVNGDEVTNVLACTGSGLTWSMSNQVAAGGWLVRRVVFDFSSGMTHVGGGVFRISSDTTDARAEPVRQPTDLCGSPLLRPVGDLSSAP